MTDPRQSTDPSAAFDRPAAQGVGAIDEFEGPVRGEGTPLSPAEKAATRDEHVKLAEGALMRADELVAGYLPGVNILRGCDFYLQDGELVGIIGPNGAGKSTLLKALFGLIPVRSGNVCFAGEDITGLAAHALVERGVGYVPR